MGKSKGKRPSSKSSKLPSLASREDLDRAIREGAAGSLVVLKFTASWCGVCQKIAPFFERLADEQDSAATTTTTEPSSSPSPPPPSVRLYTVDVDEAHDLTNFYGASALPLFLFLVDGKKVDTLVGAQQTALRKKLLKHAAS